MKRFLICLILSVLLLLPAAQAHAETAYVTGDELLTYEEQASLSARAEEIYDAHGVALYFFYDSSVDELIPYVEQFAQDAPEEQVLVLGFNARYYYFSQKGDVAKAAFPKDVCDTLHDGMRGLGNYNGVLAYLNGAEDVLIAYEENGPAATEAPVPAATAEPVDVPSYIALTAGGKPALVDEDRLLTDSEAEALSKKLVEIGNAYQCDVIIVTVPSLGSKTSEAFADDYFDYNGYGYGAVPDATGTTINGDGILLLISMEDRDFAISTSGYGITAFTDYGIQTYLEDAFLPYLSENRFNDGFLAFANSCGELLKMAREGVPYDCLHIYASDESVTPSQLQILESHAQRQATENDLGVYFVQSDSVADMDAFVSEFLYSRVSESSAILLGVDANGNGSVQVTGTAARKLFSDSVMDALAEAVRPYFAQHDLYGAIDAYIGFCEKTVDRRFIRAASLTEEQSTVLNVSAKALRSEHGVGVYFIADDSAEDPAALVSRFLSESVADTNAIVFGKTAGGVSVQTSGYLAQEKFSARDLKRIAKKVQPYLDANDLNGAVAMYLERTEKVLTRTPVNWLTFGVAVVVGALLGGIPVSAMKRQLTGVSKQRTADRYLEPDSYAVTQNSDVLLGTNTTRTVHVVAESSSSSGGRGGGGGGFHGGSSTHTSSSGGTHGGHSGKF